MMNRWLYIELKDSRPYTDNSVIISSISQNCTPCYWIVKGRQDRQSMKFNIVVEPPEVESCNPNPKSEIRILSRKQSERFRAVSELGSH